MRLPQAVGTRPPYFCAKNGDYAAAIILGFPLRPSDGLVKLPSRHGGLAAKVCGAGGGGCVLFMVKPGARDRVGSALAAAGARILDCKIAKKGLRISVG